MSPAPSDEALTAARVHLLEHGWAVLREVVPEPEVDRLCAAFDACIGTTGLPPVVQRPGAFRLHADLRRWLLDGRLGRIASALLEAPKVRLLQDALIGKPAGMGGEVPWHRDASYTGYLAPDRVLSVRLALGVEDLDRGGLEVLDGSHRWPEPVDSLHGEPMLQDGLAGLAPAQRAQVDASRGALVLQPGDLSVHTPRTWHRSAPNRSGSARRTVVAHLFDAECVIDVERIAPASRVHFPLDEGGRLKGTGFPVVV